ncbi:hypothetical protein HYALB_00013285 [Hymenoscyphus albidus]|uniref:Enoyl reductase (ER) domain-containing protein n=1 Tax=Hymenoscyphus albidus TaxID=595503 RepID=A0A9N9LYQ1_9HELO|nr:hypothetical protein HYALB_00013285 [Hymenoscyphus albidus]
MRSELLLDFATCEVVNFDENAAAIAEMVSKFYGRNKKEALLPDYEYVINKDVVYVGRFYHFTLKDSLVSEGENDKEVLTITTPGRLNTLKWVGKCGSDVLGEDEVEIVICAAGLTFRPSLGWEGSGIIKRVGSKVTHLKAGDRGAAFGENLLQTSNTMKAAALVEIPDSMSFNQASSSFSPYLTAMYSTINSVLISYTARAVAWDSQQLRSRACSSLRSMLLWALRRKSSTWFRSMGYLEAASSTHDIPPSRTDLCQKRKILWVMENWIWMFSLGIAAIARLMESLAKLLGEGKLPSLQPLKVFDMTTVEEAFRYMQPGQNIGRICISPRESPDSHIDLTTMVTPRTLQLDGNASYVLVGGLGVLGRAIATWMVENGARNLIYISRNDALGSDDKLFEAELNSSGCNVTFLRGSVSIREDVDRAIAASILPLKGILQMSAVFKDENLSKMTID